MTKEVKKKEKIKKLRQKNEAGANRGIHISENAENMTCVVCSFPILNGQAYRVLMPDAKNKEKRFYHESSCSPGSGNWTKFRGEKSKTKPWKKQKIDKPMIVPDTNIQNVEIDFTLDLATEQIREAIAKDSSNSKDLANLLTGVKERFFSQKGKKAGWKMYVEKAISYSYRQAQNLLKGYSNPIIREFWEELGIAKISLLNRVKQPLTPELVRELIPLTVSETQRALFPKGAITKKSIMPINKELLEACQHALSCFRDHPDLHEGIKIELERVIAKAMS